MKKTTEALAKSMADAEQAKRIKELETKLTLFISRG